MPRKGDTPKRRPEPDTKYADVPMETRRRITKFINGVMLMGKRNTAERLVYGAFEIIADRLKDDPIKTFDKALSNVRPRLEVRSRRVGGATYQVPVDVRPERAQALAMRWLISYSRNRGEKTMTERLAAELMDAGTGRGATVKKREDTHKMAEANKAFAHYRW
ncbi:MAG: 30S ribosomal protein S7 [Deltaproteobacteria bacterium]|nr:30S ribosomal protein S7 [Deltaproteobacteria bacterium]